MRISLYTGTSPSNIISVSSGLSKHKPTLLSHGILFPSVVGKSTHTRIESVAVPVAPTLGLFSGIDHQNTPLIQTVVTHLRDEIAAEVRAKRPAQLLVALPHAGLFANSPDAIKSIFGLLSEFSDDLYAVLDIADPTLAKHEMTEMLLRHGRTAMLDGSSEGAENIDIAVPETEFLQNNWQQVFGSSEVHTISNGFPDLLNWLGLSLLDIQSDAIAQPLLLDQMARLLKANVALDDPQITQFLREEIHADILGTDDDISSVISRFESSLKEDQKQRRVRTRIQRRFLEETVPPQPKDELSDGGKEFLDTNGKSQVESLLQGPFAPRNTGVVNFNEAVIPLPLEPNIEQEKTDTLFIVCIKNEAPYILEWIAHHQGIGVDNFLFYSNDCSDGSAEMLNRLDQLGIIHHENNDEWKGKSPQQAALNKALNHKAYRKAKWIAHIDIDEFVNLRWGENGTLSELYAMMGNATNLAMTWRLFGHNNIHDFSDDLITRQFTGAVPTFCPKPHTAWGFKTLLRNVGAYAKLSCHRPNKLDDDRVDDVAWLNGSMMPMPENVKTQGWRSSVNNIGYDAVQLNHYALRSADSFLVKRQRGRALHVDRSIGLNYWVRMDWNLHRDMTIQRFVPRTEARLTDLKSDPVIADLHEKGVAWHKAKAEELKNMPEFGELYEQIKSINLTDVERAAAALAADMET